ncbi:MAG: class I SAM-dependent methyltransferase [Aestuariibacter sp.]
MLQYENIKIESPQDGGQYLGVNTDFWQETIGADVGEIKVPTIEPGKIELDFLLEKHHHLYGRPWVLGKYFFEFLQSKGMKPTDKFLDFGCGTGRLAIRVIPFLEEGHYFGVDSHLRSLQALASYEIPVNDLAHKKPRVILDSSFQFDFLGEQFDWATDLFVTYHFDQETRMMAYKNLSKVLKTGGRIITLMAPEVPKGYMEEIGLELEFQEVQPCPLLVNHEGMLAENPWFVYKKV